jgi:hypothetical protein
MVAKVLHTPIAQAAGTVNGTGIDCKGYDESLILLALGTIPSTGTVDVKIQESRDNGVADTFTDITGAVFTQKVAGTGALTYVGRINLHGRKRYLRSVVVVANQTVPMGVLAILSQAQVNPVTQVNAVAFNV